MSTTQAKRESVASSRPVESTETGTYRFRSASLGAVICVCVRVCERDYARVCVKGSEKECPYLSSWLANIILSEKKLGRKICVGAGRRVVKGHALHPCQNDILSGLHAKP